MILVGAGARCSRGDIASKWCWSRRANSRALASWYAKEVLAAHANNSCSEAGGEAGAMRPLALRQRLNFACVSLSHSFHDCRILQAKDRLEALEHMQHA